MIDLETFLASYEVLWMFIKVSTFIRFRMNMISSAFWDNLMQDDKIISI